MEFDNFSFIGGHFENLNDEGGFLAEFCRDDRGYRRLRPYLLAGIAKGMTPVRMEFISIPAAAYPDVKKKIYKMTADAMFERKRDKNTIERCKGIIVIDRVCFEHIEPQNIEMVDGKIVIRNFDLVLQYQTSVETFFDLEDSE